MVLPGEPMHVHVVKEGKEAGQGVAYLDDGTMVVVEHGKRLIGQTVDVTVTTIYQTAAGRMIFARQRDEETTPRKAVTSRRAGGRPGHAHGLPRGPSSISVWAACRSSSHTLRALARARGVAGIVVAVPAAHVAATRRLLARLRVPRITRGGRGRRRPAGVGVAGAPAGPGATPSGCWSTTRSGPSSTRRWWRGCWPRPASHGAATCGMPVRETVKRVREDGAIEATHRPRQGLWLTQTPQAFRRALLWEAHDKARRDGFAGTDDAVLVERLGVTVAHGAGARAEPQDHDAGGSDRRPGPGPRAARAMTESGPGWASICIRWWRGGRWCWAA